jgi:hypothetical protein
MAQGNIPITRSDERLCGAGERSDTRGSPAYRCAHAGYKVTSFYPRPTNGIFDAITVMVSTLASSGKVAM